MTAGLLATIVGLQGIALSVVMAAAWMFQQRTGNSGWVDTTWTFGLGAIAVVSALLPLGGSPLRQGIVAVLITVWALRLGLHIARRTANITDDPRYATLASDWGADAPRQMFWLLQKQALVSVPLAAAMLLAAQNPAPLGWGDGLAILVLVGSIVGEAVSDRQLRNFRRDPAHRGLVCDSGLWAWSRHPNYFFEWAGWLAYPLLAIDLSGAYPLGWLALIGPVCMYWLLAHVSGIPPLEAHMLQTRGEAYRRYQARTSAFFPWPPRSSETEVVS